MKESITYTRGDIIVEEIEVGDVHYEFSGPFGIECKVLTKPERTPDGNFQWKSENMRTGKTINYFIHTKYPHYGPKLYKTKAYNVSEWI